MITILILTERSESMAGGDPFHCSCEYFDQNRPECPLSQASKQASKKARKKESDSVKKERHEFSM